MVSEPARGFPRSAAWMICAGWAILMLSLPLAGCSGRPSPSPLRVLAATSLVDLVRESSQRVRPGGLLVVPQFAASAEGRRQVEKGAPADVFLSADAREVDVLERQGLLLAGTRRSLYGNRLVLVQPLGAAVVLRSASDLASSAVRRIGVGEPGTVPAGRYAQQALQGLGLLPSVQGRLVMGTNVRVVLGWVERGEVDAAFVYQTDVHSAAARVRVVEILPESSHDPIVYPAAVVATSAHVAEARAFIAFLASAEGAGLARRFGFQPLVIDAPAPGGTPSSPAP